MITKHQDPTLSVKEKFSKSIVYKYTDKDIAREIEKQNKTLANGLSPSAPRR
jgi:hypothetical protein